ncbi:MAG: alpha/beta hydrolase [Anaerolineales bacterium]
MLEPFDITVNNWHLKIREPDSAGPHSVILLIHGWTGDENSMWVFAPRLPKNALLIAPRAPYVSRHPEIGGCSWVEERGDSFSHLAQFANAILTFDELIADLGGKYAGDFSRFGMVGFSQGAAFCFAFAMSNPHRIDRLASLAGFMPSETQAGDLANLKDIPTFIAHGVKDETVPVTMAREARQSLESAGAQVSYCESDTGHKLGANCYSAFADFFGNNP